MNIRLPHVAGSFYPDSAEAIEAFMRDSVDCVCKKHHAKAVIMPHAGYMFSGKTAAMTISQVVLTDTVFLLGPNHTGYGAPFSLMAHGAWRTPLGDVAIDEELAAALCAASPYLEHDCDAHREEHSLEVELPFLQYLKPAVKIVPLTIGTHDFATVRAVGEAIAVVLAERNVLILVSSDMTHFESVMSAEKKDKHALAAVCQLDEDALARVVMAENISMCGFVPTYCALVATKRLGATQATLVHYCTSADATGDTDRVVGYAGVVIV